MFCQESPHWNQNLGRLSTARNTVTFSMQSSQQTNMSVLVVLLGTFHHSGRSSWRKLRSATTGTSPGHSLVFPRGLSLLPLLREEPGQSQWIPVHIPPAAPLGFILDSRRKSQPVGVWKG